MAVAISNLTVPPIIAVFTFALINYTVVTGSSFVILTLLTTLFATLVPLCFLVIGARKTLAHDLDIPSRVKRDQPLLIEAVSCFVGAKVLLLVQAPPITTVVMFGYGVGTLVIFFINLRWNISIHAMGIAGPTVILIFVFGYWGALLGFLLPSVLWGGVYLKKHTITQALAGALVDLALLP